jgi:hypothetical protein
MAMVPHERSLVNRLAGRPFVLLGVNEDYTPDGLKRVQEKNDIPWRSWFDGHRSPIAAKYRVEYYPTLYLIDHVGVIRKTYVGPPPKAELDLDVEQLIEEAEADAPVKSAANSKVEARPVS